MVKVTEQRAHDQGMRYPESVIRDEIHTEDIEYVKALYRMLRDKGKILHAGFMWRVTKIVRNDNSKTVNYGGMIDGGPPPGLYHIPAPETFIFLLERKEK